VPDHIWIPAIGVNAPMVSKASIQTYDAHLGREVNQFGVPTGKNKMFEVAWWSDGPRIGEKFAVKGGELIPVLLGHTEINGFGVFNRLGELKKGQTMMIAAKNRHLKQCSRVVQKPVTGIPKDDFYALTAVLQSAPKSADLAVITCSGLVNANINSRNENTVVFFQQVSC
jgi:sortase (surface protein transpeptidase)